MSGTVHLTWSQVQIWIHYTYQTFTRANLIGT